MVAFRNVRADGPFQLRFDARRREFIERFGPRKTGRGGSHWYADQAGEDSKIAGTIFQRSLTAPHADL